MRSDVAGGGGGGGGWLCELSESADCGCQDVGARTAPASSHQHWHHNKMLRSRQATHTMVTQWATMEEMMSHHKPFPYLLGDLIGKPDWRWWRRWWDCWSVLGQGGQGNVYSAVHIYTNLPVAVKVVDKRKVKTWDLLMGRSVPREFKLLYQLQGQFRAHSRLKYFIPILQTWRESSNI